MILKESNGELTVDAKWLLGVVSSLIIVVAIPLIGFQWQQSSQLQEVTFEIRQTQKTVEQAFKVYESLSTDLQLVRERIQSNNERLLLIEQREITPGAKLQIERLQARIEAIEKLVPSQ